MLPTWLVYDPTSPSGVRFACNYNKAKAGDVAGTRTRNYWYVSINGKRFAAHRLVWEHFNGTIPDGMEVDHKDGWANSIDNLRVATRGQNVSNTKAQHNNKTGLKGVSPSKCGFYGRVVHNGAVHQKHFKTAEAAYEWCCATRERLHGEFHRHS